MESKDLNGFRQMAEAIYKSESKFRPALRTATENFKKRCLAMLAHGARETAARYKGMRTGLVKGERIPVSQIAAKGARSMFRKYLDQKKIPRSEVGQSDEVTEDGNSVTASVKSHLGNDYHEEESKVFQRKAPRGPPPGFGEGSSTPDPARIWKDAAWDGQHVIAKPATLAHSGAWHIRIPGMAWGAMRKVERAWRRLRGDVRGPISLIDANLEELHSVPGTELRLTRGPFTYRRPNRYAKQSG